jgi:hypothetical protein
MIFHADITFILALIALASGTIVVLLAKAQAEAMSITCKVIGVVIIVLSILMGLYSVNGMFKKRMVKRAMIYNVMQQKRMMLRNKMLKPRPAQEPTKQ